MVITLWRPAQVSAYILNPSMMYSLCWKFMTIVTLKFRIQYSPVISTQVGGTVLHALDEGIYTTGETTTATYFGPKYCIIVVCFVLACF